MGIDERMTVLAGRIVDVPGICGVTLGGSRARGTHRPDSDWDFGIYYSGDFDVAALQRIADDAADEPVTLTPRGGWGPWVDGGGWLTMDGVAVDWLYRDLDHVDVIAQRAGLGEFAFHRQVGHPLGFLDVAYLGELALAQIIADPTGKLEARRTRCRDYPPALAHALVANCLWEADFDILIAGKGAAGGDATYVAGVLSHALTLLAHALHAHARGWVTTEKGIVPAASTLTGAPADFAARAHACFGHLDPDPAELRRSVDAARLLVAEVRMAVEE
ncbi:nucleotidyltransferase domain-containing protein [Gordonia sp. (in: high G+C Gram-positive bacteria)]|jgi:hypothetical protein|uniref:nucleotidyltransferase domain-containing protein n=1 Tax=Gordonia sp. (in: high G+C Gram-positive bacteria) TaxID=84139 RepID=UPI001DA31E1E|nr:nucleotidyltransferase domain-containing protein [Gordonia sp. (in: high G+C Gram-positive bacteria)]MCB1294314.1 nucleotidyltransferase domain-containing protein [Gordonia sp. (in: high G+C Gram-positive bacteria)]HMS76580.1 nucleotidyltransferase domain-containing protein [Gordonia sp. (in: high G+C Gram-positive bacteria)]